MSLELENVITELETMSVAELRRRGWRRRPGRYDASSSIGDSASTPVKWRIWATGMRSD